jgi:hypothetical protein
MDAPLHLIKFEIFSFYKTTNTYFEYPPNTQMVETVFPVLVSYKNKND